MADLQRPGGELASRPIHFFWVVDCSGSMSYDGKMEVVNTAIEECIPEMASAADNNPNAQLLIRALQFSSGASWEKHLNYWQHSFPFHQCQHEHCRR